MERWVDISFDCLPLRSVTRLDIPLDASPRHQRRCEAIKRAIGKHGSHNSYYLYNAQCAYHLTNREDQGLLLFRFEGTVLTDEADRRAVNADLEIELERETCSWLTEPVLAWFQFTVRSAVLVEFDRYIAAGDLEQTRKRLEQLQAATEESGGYIGMYL
jgi:hypothetical protein